MNPSHGTRNQSYGTNHMVPEAPPIAPGAPNMGLVHEAEICFPGPLIWYQELIIQYLTLQLSHQEPLIPHPPRHPDYHYKSLSHSIKSLLYSSRNLSYGTTSFKYVTRTPSYGIKSSSYGTRSIWVGLFGLPIGLIALQLEIWYDRRDFMAYLSGYVSQYLELTALWKSFEAL